MFLNLIKINAGSDAVQPFITKTIEEMYGTEDVDVNVMFTYTSAEMLMLLSPKMLNIKELNSNFSILLPFKSLKLSPDSEVSDLYSIRNPDK